MVAKSGSCRTAMGRLAAVGVVALCLLQTGCVGMAPSAHRDQADPAVMRLLRAELLQILEQPRDATYGIWIPDYYRAEFDGAVRLLTWRHGLIGDYDLNGEVNMGDITPLGNLWGAVVEYGQRDSRKGWVDGDQNGEINLADLTPVGSNFGLRVLGYRVLGAESLDPGQPDSGYSTLAEFPLSAASPGWPPTFEFLVPEWIDVIQLASINEPEVMLLPHALGSAAGSGDDGFVDFTDPRTGDTYRVIAGVVMVNCRLALDHPKVLAFIAAEKLVLAESIPEFMYFVAYLPPETTLEDAVGNWPSEYPDVVIAVDPDSLISPHI